MTCITPSVKILRISALVKKLESAAQQSMTG